MLLIKSILLFFICIRSFFCSPNGTVTSDYGRIGNMADQQIHVASALTLTDCVRQCLDFVQHYNEYPNEDCYAYNYQFDEDICELIHSTVPLDYRVDFQSRWITGFKH